MRMAPGSRVGLRPARTDRRRLRPEAGPHPAPDRWTGPRGTISLHDIMARTNVQCRQAPAEMTTGLTSTPLRRAIAVALGIYFVGFLIYAVLAQRALAADGAFQLLEIMKDRAFH